MVEVLRVAALDPSALATTLAGYGLSLEMHALDAAVPGSFWGAPEAGLQGAHLHLRADTPVHSALHEACHFICMDAQRRAALDTDAGGDHMEENAVCYLQILLADQLPGFGREQALRDMDVWGYSFRLGSARSWFEGDAEDARAWLLAHGLIDAADRPTGRLRMAA